MKTEIVSVKSVLKTAELDASAVLEKKSAVREKLLAMPDLMKPGRDSFAERFENICKFTSGGVGDLYKAKDLLFDRVVAVKTLQSQFAGNESAELRFMEESLLNARLDHPSIVPIYGFGRDKDGNWSVAMKYLSGQTLRSFLNELRNNQYKKKKILDRQERTGLISRLEYFLKICDVVDYCHRNKIVHGDLKPENIILSAHGSLYLLDWGCAKAVHEPFSIALGTPSYLPPEFFDKPIAEPAVDIHALGVILFELVTMRLAGTSTRLKTGVQASEDEKKLENQICDIRDPANCYHLNRKLSISPAIKAVIRKATELDPVRRYTTVRALQNDVRRFIYGDPVSVLREGLLTRFFRWIGNHRKLVFFSVLILLLGLPVRIAYVTNANQEILRTERTTRMKDLQMFSTALEISRKIDLLHFSVREKLLQAGQQLQMPLLPGMRKKPNTPKEFSGVCLRQPSGAKSKLSPEMFGLLCSRMFSTRDFTENQKRFSVEWSDGSLYTWPGRPEDPHRVFRAFREAESSEHLTLLAAGRKDGLLMFRIGITDRNGTRIGYAGLQLPIRSAYGFLEEILNDQSGMECHFVTEHGLILSCPGGGHCVFGKERSRMGFRQEEILKFSRLAETSAEKVHQIKNADGRSFLICAVHTDVIPGALLVIRQETEK